MARDMMPFLARVMMHTRLLQKSMESARARARRELRKASEAAEKLARARAMVADTEAAVQALNAQVGVNWFEFWQLDFTET